MNSRYYLTTPLYYVNSKPHIGHSYTEIAADTLARYKRLTGNEVLFLTGTDEHGQKIERAAQAAGMDTQTFTDKISRTFKELWKTLNISYDDFIRTTEERHKKSVHHVWAEIKKATVKVNGKDESVLYPHHYDGFYCVSCETFITEGLLDPANPNACPDCKRPLERMEEDTYFLRISAYQERLIKDIGERKIAILPDTRRNEVLGFLQHNQLKDLSISRPKNRLAWGIPLPFDDQHVTYVWFDALINYISACGYGTDEEMFKKWWPADVHFIGKDILRHHAVLWPILLYALNLELPRMIFAHGWWVQGGEKMSKSRGNVVDPIEVVKEYGVDAYRYFLLRETPFGKDGTFSEEALIKRYNTELANDLGNLLSRSLTMCEKYFDSQIPPGVKYMPAKESDAVTLGQLTLRDTMEELPKRLSEAMQVFAYDNALDEIWILINRANKYIEDCAPWKIFKEGRIEDLTVVILSLLKSLRVTAQAIWPFMPATAEQIWAQLGLFEKPYSVPFDGKWGFFEKGGKIAKGTVLFPRIEVKKT